jgi:hypothetical protein
MSTTNDLKTCQVILCSRAQCSSDQFSFIQVDTLMQMSLKDNYGYRWSLRISLNVIKYYAVNGQVKEHISLNQNTSFRMER